MKKLMRAWLATLCLAFGLVLSSASASAQEAESPQPAAVTSVSIPVLCYHVVSDTPSGRYQLSLSKFREQMAYLATNGYTPLSADQYYSVMTSQSPAPNRPILLTFDDNTSDFVTNVVPVLKQYGFTATQFAVSGWVDTAGHLSSTQLKALATEGYDVQNHTQTHQDLSTLAYAGAYDEVRSADTFITSITAKKPEFLAYPYGRYDATAQQALRDVGVKMAFTVSGGKTTPADDFLALNRNMIVSSETMSSFVKKVS